MSPRPFERPALIALPDGPGLPAGAALDGLWLPARPGSSEPDGDARADGPGLPSARGGAVVAAPHPLMGGSMDSPVATELALAASDAGYVALRFNWRGVGGSAGRPSGEIADADDDTRAALDFMRESVEGPIIACGYSWGSLAAFRTGIEAPRVQKLVLVAPPPAMLDRERLACGRKPILIVTGDRDDYVPLAALRELVDGIERLELVVLPDVDHFFMSGLQGLGRAVRGWLE
ncbi:MAG: alpha/beta fold hydrolase [Deltaproteobacteria bacterium]|nr:alpha/beta fold hydrolase [Deltaproteobacteria bacterium]